MQVLLVLVGCGPTFHLLPMECTEDAVMNRLVPSVNFDSPGAWLEVKGEIMAVRG